MNFLQAKKYCHLIKVKKNSIFSIRKSFRKKQTKTIKEQGRK